MNWMLTVTALFDAFDGLMKFVLAYAILVAVLLFKGTKEERRIFVWPAVFLALTLYNPVVIAPISDAIGLTARVRRIYWLLPVTMLIAYMIVKGFGAISDQKKKWIFLAVCVAAIVVFGVPQIRYFERPDNIYKISDEMIELDEILIKDGGEEEKIAAFTSDGLLGIRQYDASVRNVLPRPITLEWQPDLEDQEYLDRVVENKKTEKILALPLKWSIFVDEDAFLEALDEKKANYVIVDKAPEKISYIEGMDLKKIGETAGYAVYKR